MDDRLRHRQMHGFWHVSAFLDDREQAQVLDLARTLVAEAPLLQPRMPDGTPLHLRLTNAGAWGWWAGPPCPDEPQAPAFRYVERHPQTQRRWPAIPELLLELCDRATALAGLPALYPDNLLINAYGLEGSLGQHQDRTEKDLTAPIVSLSLGAEALFVLGGPERRDRPICEVALRSGDLVIQSGPSRSYFHGVRRLFPVLGNPLRNGGRLNLTFRRVYPR